MKKNKWFLNGGRGSGRSLRLLCETYENKISNLEKENANVKEALEGYKKIAKWCDKCDKIAELKSENQRWKDEWQEQVQKATDEGYARTLQSMQLTKAKELLKRWVELSKPKLEGYPIPPIQEQTEQFLSEVEK